MKFNNFNVPSVFFFFLYLNQKLKI